jgi:hypothetical protein
LNDDKWISVRRRLRMSLLGDPDAIHRLPVRNLAAHLLQREGSNDCLSIATDSLREAFKAD